MSVLRSVIVCMCREGEGSLLNNLPVCTSMTTDRYHHHSQLRQTQLKLITCTGQKAPLFNTSRHTKQHKPNIFQRCKDFLDCLKTTVQILWYKATRGQTLSCFVVSGIMATTHSLLGTAQSMWFYFNQRIYPLS